MAKLYIIAGHGAGDPGACANGYQEAERVRKLAARIEALGGSKVEVLDTSRDWYADAGINSLSIAKSDCLLELHMDSASASAKGGHVIIYGGYDADEYDKALAKFISGYFPGRSNTIVKRTDLANPKRAANKGINYRLLECCFISNADDLAKFNNNMDEVAKGILAAFGIGASSSTSSSNTSNKTATTTTSSKKSVSTIADEVIAGKWGNGDTRKKKLEAAGYNYSEVQAKVNEKLGVSTAKKSNTKSVDTLAQEVIDGKWGNGSDRKKRLEAAGYNYAAVQKRVNQLLS